MKTIREIFASIGKFVSDDNTKGEIIFASKFIDMIDSGKKTTTVRRGVRTYEPGTYKLFNPAKSVEGLINIKGTAIVNFGQLTEEVAQTDGFRTLYELKKELLSFYPELTDDDPVTIVYIEKYTPEDI